jgi:hypothetical protein
LPTNREYETKNDVREKREIIKRGGLEQESTDLKRIGLDLKI